MVQKSQRQLQANRRVRTKEEEAAARQAYSNAGRDDEYEHISDQAALVSAAIKSKRAELTGDATCLIHLKMKQIA